MHLIHQQEVWIPTLQGWLVSLVCVMALIMFFVRHIYAFLAVNFPIKADILVFEGDMTKEFIRTKLGFSNLYTFWGKDSDGAFSDSGRVTYTIGSEREEQGVLDNVIRILEKEGFKLELLV